MVERRTGEVLVRDYDSADRDDVLRLAERLTIGVAEWRDTEQVLAAARKWVEDSIDARGADSTVLVAEGEQGERLGFVSVARKTHFSGDLQAYVGELVVDAAAEGRGVGRQLMLSAEAWARERGLRFITLDTGAGNAGARAFYGRLGYLAEDVSFTKVLT